MKLVKLEARKWNKVSSQLIAKLGPDCVPGYNVEAGDNPDVPEGQVWLTYETDADPFCTEHSPFGGYRCQQEKEHFDLHKYARDGATLTWQKNA